MVNVIEANDLANVMGNRIADILLSRLAEQGAIIPHTPEPEKLLKLGEACKMLQMSYPTLRKLIDRGQVPALFDGGKSIRIRLSDIRAYQSGIHQTKKK